MAAAVNDLYVGPSATTIYGGTFGNAAVAPGAGALTLTGFAPTVSQGGARAAAPGVGVVNITGYAPTVSQGTPLGQNFTLISPNTQAAAAFTMGVFFGMGDVPGSFVTSLSNYQVVVKRRWNDGSVKHAIISGRAPLVASTPLTVTMSSGTPPAGSNLTSSSISAASPTASIQCGAIGTVSLASLLSSPFRTWISGPEMVECHYQAAVGGGTLLSVWFHVRLFIDGRMWIRCICENGYLDNGAGAVAGNANRSYVPTVTINGSTVYNNGTSVLSHSANTRWSFEGWIGTDPAVTPLHNAAQLRATKLVPNYGYTGASSTALNSLSQTYTPMTNGPHTTDMGGTGYQAAIGLIPNWDALYCTTADARAHAAVLAGSSAVNSYPIVWRDKTTNLALRPSDFGTWNPTGPGGGGNDSYVTGLYTWEVNHHPSEGYLAYLITGDYWHLETLALGAAMVWLQQDSSLGSGTSRLLRRQTRGVAWALRTVGQYAAIAPDADIVAGQVAADYVTLLANNYADLKVQAQSENTSAWIGSLYQYQFGSWTGTGSIAPWMLDFWVSVNGMLSEIEPLPSSNTDLVYVRDWMYRWTVGRLGESGVIGDFDFTRAGQYGINVATSDLGTTYYQKWGDIFNATFAVFNTTPTNTLQGASGSDPANMSTGYWGNLMPALTYAVDHRAPGAITAWLRLSGASNFAASAATFNDTPVFGTAPRSLFSPGYSLPSSANTSTLIGTNTAQSVKPASYTTTEFDQSTLYPFSGGTFIPTYSAGGAYALANTGGHTNLSFQGTLLFDFLDATWKRLDNINGVPYSQPAVDVSLTSGSPNYEMTSATAGQMPCPSHAYALPQFLNEGIKGSFMYPNRAAVTVQSTSSGVAHKQDLNTGLWTRLTSTQISIQAGFEGSACYDRNLDRYYVVESQFWNDTSIPFLRNRDKTWQSRALNGFPPSGSNYSKVFCFPERRLLLIHCAVGLFGHDLTLGSGAANWVALTTSGTIPSNGQNTWIYHPRTGKFYQKGSSTGNVINVLTPPSNTGGTTGTWTFSTITIAGSGLPDRTLAQEHYTCLQYVPAIDRLCWISDTTTQVALIKV